MNYVLKMVLPQSVKSVMLKMIFKLSVDIISEIDKEKRKIVRCND